MKKKIKDLTDEQLYSIIYESESELGEPITYEDRLPYPDDEETPAKDITYDNCRFCCRKSCSFCGIKCKKEYIDFDEIRNSIYAEDEVEIYE